MDKGGLILALVTSLIMGLLSTHIALRKGRDPVIWFILGLGFGVVALFILYVLSPFGFGGESEEAPTPEAEEQERVWFESQQWYYLDDNRAVQGPVPFRQLGELWHKGELLQGSYIWCPSWGDWQLVHDVSKLEEQLQRSAGEVV